MEYTYENFLEVAKQNGLADLEAMEVLLWDKGRGTVSFGKTGSAYSLDPDDVPGRAYVLYREYLLGEWLPDHPGKPEEVQERLAQAAEQSGLKEPPQPVSEEEEAPQPVEPSAVKGKKRKGGKKRKRTEDEPRAAIKAEAAYLTVPLEAIELSGEENVRTWTDEEHLKSLTESMASRGVINAPEVVASDDGRYRVVTGTRRIRAAKAAGLEAITVKILPSELPAVERIVRQVAENEEREDLDPVDEAHAVAQLKAAGLKGTEIAERLKKSSAWVTQTLKITTLSPEVVEAARGAGVATQTFLIELAGVPEERRMEALNAAVEAGGAASVLKDFHPKARSTPASRRRDEGARLEAELDEALTEVDQAVEAARPAIEAGAIEELTAHLTGILVEAREAGVDLPESALTALVDLYVEVRAVLEEAGLVEE